VPFAAGEKSMDIGDRIDIATAIRATKTTFFMTYYMNVFFICQQLLFDVLPIFSQAVEGNNIT
jgi:hypothetical protein